MLRGCLKNISITILDPMPPSRSVSLLTNKEIIKGGNTCPVDQILDSVCRWSNNNTTQSGRHLKNALFSWATWHLILDVLRLFTASYASLKFFFFVFFWGKMFLVIIFTFFHTWLPASTAKAFVLLRKAIGQVIPFVNSTCQIRYKRGRQRRIEWKSKRWQLYDRKLKTILFQISR